VYVEPGHCAGLFRSCDILFTKRSHNGAQIEQTKGFDPIQKARHVRAFCFRTPYPLVFHAGASLRVLDALADAIYRMSMESGTPRIPAMTGIEPRALNCVQRK
jgi:hypothetical protein